jgi:nucleotide-binding universal stress UspA family protein
MCLPRSVSDRISTIGLGHLGPKVRAILQAAHFPVLIPSSVLKKWKSVIVFFGGSANALNALKVGITIAKTTGVPLTLFIQSEGKDLDEYTSIIRKAELLEELDDCDALWSFFPEGSLESNLYTVPHDALVIAGAYGQGVIRTVMFGSKMELLQSTLPNNFLIVGPGYTG